MKPTLILFTSALALLPAVPAKDPLTLAVAVESSAGKVRAETGAKGERPHASAKLGETPKLRWFLKNPDRKKPYPQSVLHFFVTSLERPGQPLPLAPAVGGLIDNAYAQEIPAGGSTGGTCELPITAAGLYLVQFEILDQVGQRQQFVGIELELK